MRQGARTRLRRDGSVVSDRCGLSGPLVAGHQQLLPVDADAGADLGGVRRVLELLSGYGGQLSFGHASFFGIGAYAVTLSLVYWNLTPWIGIPFGALLGAIAAIIIGTPTFRLRGHYFALAMLAYPLAILYVLQYLGFQEVSLPMHRENPAAYLSSPIRGSTRLSRSACWSPA